MPDTEDWRDRLGTSPGALWILPDFEWRPDPPEPAIPVPADLLELADAVDGMYASLLGIQTGAWATLVRQVWLAHVGPRWCNCPHNHHRWNCPMTPIWAQTIQDLDLNPWTVFEKCRAYGALKFLPIRINDLDGLPGTYCGRGPCCRNYGHSGRCQI